MAEAYVNRRLFPLAAYPANERGHEKPPVPMVGFGVCGLKAGVGFILRLMIGKIDLVLTDVVMPVMGGKEMADALRRSFPDTKVLFTSGYSDNALVEHGVLRSDIRFLQKPYLTATLTRKVSSGIRQALFNSAESAKEKELATAAVSNSSGLVTD